MSLITRFWWHVPEPSAHGDTLRPARYLGVGLGSLAIAMLGTTLAAPAHAAVTPDTLCTVVPSSAAKVLLMDAAGGTLDSWGGRSGPGHRTCRWEARPADGGSVRVMRLAVDTYPTPAAAQAAMTTDIMQAAASSGALPRGSGDQLASSDPMIVQARHGAVLATIDVTDGQVSAPPWAQHYWLAATALAGAGGRYLPPPSLPGMMPAGQGGADGAPLWQPPSHDGGVAGQVLAAPLALMRLLASWRFMLLVALVIGGIVFASTGGKRRIVRRLLTGAGIYAVLNIMLGTGVSDRLIYWLGTVGAATITGTHATAVQYNNQNVSRHDVLVRTAEGKVVHTSFADDDFDVYPPHNATRYPGEGDQFTVRYMPGFPRQFVIVANDASPWAQRLRCGGLGKALDAARQSAAFAGAADQQAARAVGDAERRLADAGC